MSATRLTLALVVFYLILGMFMDVLSMQVATISITYPVAVAVAVGVDPIRCGIFFVPMCELGADHAAGRHELVHRARHPTGQGGH